MTNKIKLTIGFALLTASFTGAMPARAGQEGGNGGGGVVKNGIYMTFYSAGLYVQPTPSGSSQASIPQLDSLIQYIEKLPQLGDHSKVGLLKAITPTLSRQYYIAAPHQLTPAIKQRLLAEFQRVTGVDPAQLALYALTDTTTQTTFILPDFFNLNANDQMAILFHEAYWIMRPNSSYNDVVQAEMAFEAVLTSADNPARVFDFVRRIGDAQETFDAEVKLDLSAGVLNGLAKQDQFGTYIPFSSIFKQDLIDCANRNFDGWPTEGTKSLHIPQVCAPILSVDAHLLSENYPRSAVVQTIASSLYSLDPNRLFHLLRMYPEAYDTFGDYVQHCGLYIQPNAKMEDGGNVECDAPDSNNQTKPEFGFMPLVISYKTFSP